MSTTLGGPRSPKLEIRAATAEDRGAVVRLVAASLAERGAEWGGDADLLSVERAVELALAPRSLAWLVVARRSGVLCGVLLANPSISPAHGGAVLRVELIHVDRPYRRRGVGQALVEFVCDEARQSGMAAVEMMLGTGEEAALGLGRRLGFREVEGRRLVRASAEPAGN
jgi:GNAT superfamily N-acetyltransferase